MKIISSTFLISVCVYIINILFYLKYNIFNFIIIFCILNIWFSDKTIVVLLSDKISTLDRSVFLLTLYKVTYNSFSSFFLGPYSHFCIF